MWWLPSMRYSTQPCSSTSLASSFPETDFIRRFPGPGQGLVKKNFQFWSFPKTDFIRRFPGCDPFRPTWVPRHRPTDTFYGLVEVGQELFEGVSLGRTTRDRRDLSPVPALFTLVNHHFDLQIPPKALC